MLLSEYIPTAAMQGAAEGPQFPTCFVLVPLDMRQTERDLILARMAMNMFAFRNHLIWIKQIKVVQLGKGCICTDSGPVCIVKISGFLDLVKAHIKARHYR